MLRTKTKEEMDKILDERDTSKAIHISNTYVIDANKPTDCYAEYANDPLQNFGMKYNAALISSLKTKTAAIIAIRDIYANDEIYVDYGNEYWNSQKQTVEE